MAVKQMLDNEFAMLMQSVDSPHGRHAISPHDSPPPRLRDARPMGGMGSPLAYGGKYVGPRPYPTSPLSVLPPLPSPSQMAPPMLPPVSLGGGGGGCYMPQMPAYGQYPPMSRGYSAGPGPGVVGGSGSLSLLASVSAQVDSGGRAGAVPDGWQKRGGRTLPEFSAFDAGQKVARKKRKTAKAESSSKGGKPKREKAFACSKCSARFTERYNMNKHDRVVHNRERPFKCSICLASFQQKDHMTKHINCVHLKKRPFKCDVRGCGASFGWRGVLVKHKVSVHHIHQ